MGDDETRAIYEEQADRWVERRTPRGLDRAQSFAERTDGPTVDLGCGPGWYAPALQRPVVAIDFALSMLGLAKTKAPDALRIAGDLQALPFRRGTFASAWASHSYLHVPSVHLPSALADLHRSMRVGGRFLMRLAGGVGEGRNLRGTDDFPGRLFALWDSDHLAEIVGAAGFEIERLEIESHPTNEDTIEVEATRARTLPDFVGPDMRVLVCGLNPSLNAADAGVGFARPGNRFWPAALAAGLVSVDRDPWHALRQHRVGFTDLVKRATVGAAELSTDEYRSGVARLERLASWLQPDVVAFVGLAGWRAAVDRKAVAGPQERTVGGRPVYVMPSSSGLNARSTVDSLTQHLRAAVALT
ncbi:MAG: double-stranded uracil-DNA glycosylase [Acidimicrobiaceae bacterium]